MKLHSFAVILGISLGSVAWPVVAADSLFVPVSNRAHFVAPGEMLQKVAEDPVNARIELVSARAELLDAKRSALRIDLPGGIEVEAKQTSFSRMESGNEVWIGSIDAAKVPLSVWGKGIPLDNAFDGIVAVRSGDTVMANIRIAGSLYRLVPVDGGAHALVEVDLSQFPPDEHEEAYAEMLAAPSDLSKPEEISGAKAISTIRVLVAFGPSAAGAVGNEQQAIDLAFAEANQALSATNTEIRLQQAGAIAFFSQSESTNYSTMLNRLTNLSDGYYDSIGSLRNSNTADMVAYIAPNNPQLCGQAAGIATTNARAYFVMNPTCLSGNYTFVHEAAHVVGARHDNDPTTSPFSYGHGYVLASVNRRTVMAVNGGVCPSCIRIGAFSSPNYTLSGVPIGTASFNDNNRVWRTRGPTVAGFR